MAFFKLKSVNYTKLLWTTNLTQSVTCSGTKRPTLLFFKSIRCKSDSCEEYAMMVNPIDFSFITTHSTEKKIPKTDDKYTFWDYIQTYRKGSYYEKSFLINPEVAKTIAEAIEKHSERDVNTKFIDADGGLCLVSKEVSERNIFKSPGAHLVFEKDANLKGLNERTAQNYLPKDCKIIQANPIQDLLESQGNGGHFVDPIYRELLQFPPTDWDASIPNYTFFGTVTHGYIKYLTSRCLHRNETQYSEFHLGRPEFFLIVSARTWTHLTLEMGNHILYMNVLFGIVFDYECVAELPRKAFLPWKKFPGKLTNSLIKRYHEKRDTFYLIKIRPKKNLGLIEGTPIKYLTYFVQAICHNHSNQRLIPMIERWLPGAGLDFVKNGFSIYKTSGDLQPSEVVPVLNLFIGQKNFQNLNNNFVVEANIFAQSQLKDRIVKTKGEKECYAQLKRDLSTNEESVGARGKRRKSNKTFRT